MPDLDEQLAAGRRRVLDAIEQPSFEPIARRAGALRRRRTLALATATATAVLVGTVAVTASIHPSPPSPPQTNSSPSPGAVYTSEGITINGLPGTLPADLPGSIVDVEFTDADRGYLLTSACVGACEYTFFTTVDGGWQWTRTPMPAGAGATPMLVPVGDAVVVAPTPTAGDVTGTAKELPGTAWLQLVPPGRCGATVAAWVQSGDGALLVPLGRQPDLTVCWTSPVREADATWWVGGVKDGAAAVAVSRDGGRSWTTTRLGSTGAGARVAMLGKDVYATVVGPSDELVAVYHSGDGGLTFSPVTHRGMPTKVGGDLVPLLDGRLLVVNGDGDGGWYVSADQGATWKQAKDLHPTQRIARTRAGYIAYRMTTIYTAFSVDGSTWRKINAT